MSSHYIIRDDQSPALLLYEVGAVSEKIIFSLLEWQPTVIADESALGFVLHNRINVDMILLNQMSEEEVDELLDYQKPYHVIEAAGVPSTVTSILREKGITAIDLIGEFDSHALKLSRVFESEFAVQIYSKHTKYIHVQNGIYSKWSSPGRGFFIAGVERPESVKLENLTSINGDHFSVEAEGVVKIESAGGFWVGEIIG